MKSGYILLFCLIIILVAGCKEENQQQQLICTEQYETISVKIKDIQNIPVALENFKVTRLVDQTDMTVKVDPAGYTIMQKQGTYPITSDFFERQLNKKNVEVVFTGMKDGKIVVNQQYSITSDGCHVKLISGEREIVIK